MSATPRFALGSEALSRGTRAVVFDALDSTNDECRRLIGEGERGPLWVIAKAQTKGRGRLGRAWISPPGNLYASFLLSGSFSAREAPQLGFVAGVAAIAALRRATGLGERIALKWPNDLLLDGCKLGGILLECVAAPSGDARMPTQSVAVVGIGVNCAFAPDGLPYRAGCLRDAGEEQATATEVFLWLADCFVQALDLWSNGEGFASIREKWLSAAAGVGGPIRVALTRDEELNGSFTTIDARGRLMVRTLSGERAVEAGDVFLSEGWPGSRT